MTSYYDVGQITAMAGRSQVIGTGTLMSRECEGPSGAMTVHYVLTCAHNVCEWDK